jgi:hypothetical protein
LSVFVRPEIKSLKDLVDKKVNFNTQGTAAAYSGPLIFSWLGLDVEKMFIPHPSALEQMRRSAMAAVVFVTSKPIDAFVRCKWEPGFKFLPVDYGPKFEDYYDNPTTSRRYRVLAYQSGDLCRRPSATNPRPPHKVFIGLTVTC